MSKEAEVIVEMILEDKVTTLKEIFSDAMRDKISFLVEERKDEVAKNIFNESDTANPVVAETYDADESQYVDDEDDETIGEARLTRKHFVAAANEIASLQSHDDRKAQAQVKAEEFSKANPRFDRDKFMKACGVIE